MGGLTLTLIVLPLVSDRAITYHCLAQRDPNTIPRMITQGAELYRRFGEFAKPTSISHGRRVYPGFEIEIPTVGFLYALANTRTPFRVFQGKVGSARLAHLCVHSLWRRKITFDIEAPLLPMVLALLSGVCPKAAIAKARRLDR